MLNRTILCLLCALTSATLQADTPTATLTGTISDPSDGVIIGATITARHIETGISRSTSANQSGIYRLLGLPAGSYEVSASQPKFTTVKRKNITLQLGDEVRIDVTLAPGESREVVVVSAAAPLVQTETSAASMVVNERAVQDLPSDGRQLQNLALLVPGIDVGWNLST